MSKPTDVMALGNIILDFLIEVDENKLLEMDLKKGEMHLVDEQQAHNILKKIEEHQLKIELCPGGSAANTLRGLALLGATVILCGKVGQDKHGQFYVEEIKKQKVQSKLSNHHLPTGKAITFITPDSERTFSVHLGASLELVKEDVLEEDIARSKILHLEGYQLEGKTRDVVLHSIHLAKKHGTLVSLDLADPGVIRRNREHLLEILNKVDFLFLNEKEALEFTGLEEQEALLELGQYVPTVILKLGVKGSLILHEEVIHFIEPFPVKALDTTGAGDTYAAGFLYGFTNSWPIEKAGNLGSLFASKIVETKGVNFSEIDVEIIKKQVS